MNIRSSYGRLTEAKHTHVNKSKRCGYILMVELIQSISLKIQSSFVWDLKLNLFEHLCPQSVGFQQQPLPLLLLLFGHLGEFVVNPASTDWGWWMYYDMKKVIWRWEMELIHLPFIQTDKQKHTRKSLDICQYILLSTIYLLIRWLLLK